MKMNEKEIYYFTNTLQLENYVKELRIAHAKYYLSDKIDLRNLSESDLLSIYTLLEIKDKEMLEKRLDEIKSMQYNKDTVKEER